MGAKGSGEAAGAGVADSTTHRSDRCAGAEQATGGLHPIVQAPLPQCQSRVAEEGTLEIPGTRVTSAAHWATVRSSPGLNSSASATEAAAGVWGGGRGAPARGRGSGEDGSER